MSEPPLSEYEVVKFLANRGGRSTNYELVSNFRGVLNHPQHQAEARLRFKDIVNAVAVVAEYQNIKYIELKKEYGRPHDSKSKQCNEFQNSSNISGSSPPSQSFQPYWRYRLSTGSQVLPPKRPDRLPHSHQSFHRSVSESTLPHDCRPRSADERRPSTVRQHSLSVPREGDPLFINKSDPFHSNHNEAFAHSSGRFLQERSSQNLTSCSLPYFPSHLTDLSPNSTSYQEYRERDVGLPVVAGPHISHTHSERLHLSKESFHERSTRGSQEHIDLNENRRVKQQSFTDPDSILSQNAQNRNIFTDFSKNSSDCHGALPYHTDNRILPIKPSGNTIHRPLSNQLDVPAFSVPAHIPSLQSSSSVEYVVEREEDHDILANPDYLRNVSKMCFEKNKTSSTNHHKKVSHKLEQNPRKAIENYGHESIHTDTKLVKTSPKENADGSDVLAKTHDSDPPLPPERRRKSQDKIQSVVGEATDSNENVNNPDSEVTVANKVRDRVQHFDQMEMQIRRRSSTINKENKSTLNEKFPSEDDVSISVLDPKLKREWFVKSSQCDYHGLVALLKKEPKLAALKDITSGYTALHWAAKHGDANVIKLIAGTYKVNPNTRSNGGYTPVHLAALYKHDIIGHLLIHTYGADPSLRDYDGKRADQYPQDYLRTRTGHKVTDRRPAKQRPLTTKQTIGNSFMRIGSLNLRKARKSTVFASVRGNNNRNRTSALDLKFGNEYAVRKRLSKKENLSIDQKRIEENKEESDSAYGFSTKDSS